MMGGHLDFLRAVYVHAIDVIAQDFELSRKTGHQ